MSELEYLSPPLDCELLDCRNHLSFIFLYPLEIPEIPEVLLPLLLWMSTSVPVRVEFSSVIVNSWLLLREWKLVGKITSII